MFKINGGIPATANIMGFIGDKREPSPREVLDTPSNLKERRMRLKGKLDDARDLSGATVDKLLAAHEVKSRAQLRLSELETEYDISTNAIGHDAEGRPIYAEPSAKMARKAFEKAAAEVRALEQQQAERRARFNHIGRLVDAIDAFAEEYRGALTNAAVPSAPAGDAAAVMEKLHAQRKTLISELAETEFAPVTKEEAIESVRAEIDALANRGAPNLGSIYLKGSSGIRWPERSEPIRNGLRTMFAVLPKGGGIAEIDGSLHLSGIDAMGLIVWANRDAILAKLTAEIEAEYKGLPKALSRAERQQKQIDLKAKLLDLARLEVAVADKADDLMLLRADIEPAALLGVMFNRPM